MNRIYALEKIIMIPLFLGGMCISFYGVLARYIFNSPVHWIEEIFSLFLVWAILIGFSTALKNNNHIALDLLYTFLSEKWKLVVDMFGYIIGLFFSLFFFYYGFLTVIQLYKVGGVSLDAKLPFWIISLILPLTGMFLFLAYLDKIIQTIKSRSKDS